MPFNFFFWSLQCQTKEIWSATYLQKNIYIYILNMIGMYHLKLNVEYIYRNIYNASLKESKRGQSAYEECRTTI